MVVTCGIYLYSNRERKILLCHPSRTRWNSWSIPKGIPEPGEDHLTCAVRELAEETGIHLSAIHLIQSVSLPARRYSKQDKVLHSFLIVTDTDLSTHVFTSNLVEGKDFPENDKWRWATLEESAGLVHETQQQNMELIDGLVSGKMT